MSNWTLNQIKFGKNYNLQKQKIWKKLLVKFRKCIRFALSDPDEFKKGVDPSPNDCQNFLMSITSSR